MSNTYNPGVYYNE